MRLADREKEWVQQIDEKKEKETSTVVCLVAGLRNF